MLAKSNGGLAMGRLQGPEGPAAAVETKKRGQERMALTFPRRQDELVTLPVLLSVGFAAWS